MLAGGRGGWLSEWGKRGALVVAAIGLSLIVFELAATWFFPVRPTRFQLDRRYLHVYVPNRERVNILPPERGGARVSVRINGLGLRGEDLAASPAGRRIVVYGDSMIAGEFSPREETFVGQLQKLLRARHGARTEVVNAGIVAYGPDQAGRRIADDVGTLKPHGVILAVYAGNDFGDLIRNKLYRVDPAGALITLRPQFSEELRERFRTVMKYFDPERFENRSMLVLRVKRAYWQLQNSVARIRAQAPDDQPDGQIEKEDTIALNLRQVAREFREFVVNDDPEVRNLFGDAEDFDFSLYPNSPAVRYKTALMAGVIRQIKETADRNGVPLLLLIIPSPFHACPGYDERFDPAPYPDYQPESQTQALVKIAAGLGLPYLDLFPLFREARDCRALFFGHGDDHWNAAGQAMAAEATARWLAKLGLLKLGPK